MSFYVLDHVESYLFIAIVQPPTSFISPYLLVLGRDYTLYIIPIKTYTLIPYQLPVSTSVLHPALQYIPCYNVVVSMIFGIIPTM